MEMKIGHALMGIQAVDAILYDEGEERKLPFRVKYKLSYVKNFLQEEAQAYEEERQKLIREFGEEAENEDGTTSIEVKDPEKLKEFHLALQEILDTEISREFTPIKEEDLRPIEDLEIDITESQLKVLFQYLVTN